MKTFTTVLGVCALTMGLSAASWAANPCMPIAKACKAMGYYKGGDTVGKGLVKNCMMPVVAGNKQLPGVNLSQNQLQQCGALISQKLKGRS